MKKVKTDNILGEFYTHPAFGTLSFSNCSGGETPLFGSSIKHNSTVRMTICKAEYCRSITSDHVFSRDVLIEATMSHTQFADAIAGIGSSSDIPITLRYIAGEGNIDGVDLIDKTQQFQEDFEQINTDVIDRVKRLESAVKAKKLPKWVEKELDVIRCHLTSNAPFVARQFTKQMERTVTEAKGEVEGYVSSVVQQYGIEAIRKQAPQLTEGAKAEGKE